MRKMTPYLAVGIAEGFEPTKSVHELNRAWQYLVDTGLAWQMQGWFGRTAVNLIAAGKIKKPNKYRVPYL